MTKDKFSALEMGVYRITEIENEEISHRRNRGWKCIKRSYGSSKRYDGSDK